MSAPGEFTPPEFPSGETQDTNTAPPDAAGGVTRGFSPGVSIAILAGVLALGLIAVFAVGRAGSGGKSLTALPGPASTVHGYAPSGSASPSPAAKPSAPASASTGAASGPASPASAVPSDPAPTTTDPADGVPTVGTSSQGPVDPPPTIADEPEFTVGECVDTSGSGSAFKVTEAGCSNADYKIIYAFQNETGNVDSDTPQCYTINGNDSEFENGAAPEGYTLYCLNSLTGDYSPRRAGVDNCLDASAVYEVDCTSSKAAWIVVGRLNGTTDTKSCSQFGSYDTSYFWTSPPPFVLCVDKYTH